MTVCHRSVAATAVSVVSCRFSGDVDAGVEGALGRVPQPPLGAHGAKYGLLSIAAWARL